jgi:hypothetical protein
MVGICKRLQSKAFSQEQQEYDDDCDYYGNSVSPRYVKVQFV